MLRTGAIDLRELSPLEEADVLEFEQRELTLRYVEQSTAILASAQNRTGAEALLEALRSEFFIGYDEANRRKRRLAADELVKMQQYAFTISPSPGGGGRLEMRPQ